MAKMSETASAARGTKIVQDFGRDNSSQSVKNPHGKKLGGSTNNLGHSLTGASAVQSHSGN